MKKTEVDRIQKRIIKEQESSFRKEDKVTRRPRESRNTKGIVKGRV